MKRLLIIMMLGMVFLSNAENVTPKVVDSTGFIKNMASGDVLYDADGVEIGPISQDEFDAVVDDIVILEGVDDSLQAQIDSNNTDIGVLEGVDVLLQTQITTLDNNTPKLDSANTFAEDQTLEKDLMVGDDISMTGDFGNLLIKNRTATVANGHIKLEGSGGTSDIFALYTPAGENTFRLGYDGGTPIDLLIADSVGDITIPNGKLTMGSGGYIDEYDYNSTGTANDMTVYANDYLNLSAGYRILLNASSVLSLCDVGIVSGESLYFNDSNHRIDTVGGTFNFVEYAGTYVWDSNAGEEMRLNSDGLDVVGDLDITGTATLPTIVQDQCEMTYTSPDWVFKNNNTLGDFFFDGRRFGVGVSPERELHILSTSGTTTIPALIEDISGGDAGIAVRTPSAAYSFGVRAADNNFYISQSSTDIANNPRMKVATNTGDIEIYNKLHVDGDLTSDGYIDGVPCGVFAYLTAAADTTITVADTYYPILGTFANDPLEQFSAATINTPGIKYDGTKTQYFKIQWSAEVEANANSTTVTISTSKNGTICTHGGMSTFVKTSGEGFNIAGICVMELATDDEVQLMITADGSGDVITVDKFNVSIQEFFD